MKYTFALLLVAGWFGAACGGAASGGESNSETHFLGYCSDQCADGLICLCGVCTVTCELAATCANLADNASCQGGEAYPDTCGNDTRPSVCDVTCNNNSDCTELGSDYQCSDGLCRLPGCVYEGEVYREGEQFPAPNSSCNTCSCGSDGQVLCTRAACDICDYGGASYAPGDSFPSTDGCNTCSCESGGIVACTLRACVEPTECSFGGQNYAPGDTFPADCNNCSCGSDGVVDCSNDCNNYCLYGNKYYADGESFPATDGCNTCSCSAAEGAALCTEIGCPVGCLDASGEAQPVGTMQPTDDGCNTCSCLDGGAWACTQRACAPTCDYAGQTYQEGESFPAGDGCNTCSCSAGQALCTLSPCTADCSLPFEGGDCLAAISVYWFNSAAGACEPEVYGGCGGNSNNFATVEDCESACL